MSRYNVTMQCYNDVTPHRDVIPGLLIGDITMLMVKSRTEIKLSHIETKKKDICKSQISLGVTT